MRFDILLIYLLLRVLGQLPLRWLHALGAFVGQLAWRVRGKLAHNVEVNLKLVYPQSREDIREQASARAMREFGKSVFEMAWIWGRGARRALHSVREVEGQELFDAALNSDKGVIIAAPHLGCWELLNYWLCQHAPMAILYRPPRYAALEPLLRKVRGDLAPEQVRAEGAGVRTLFKRLRQGGNVGILPDQKPRQGEGEVVPFFGQNAATMVLLPRLAQRTGATVLFAFAERLPRGKGYRIHFQAAPEAIADKDTNVACAALNAGVEACVQQAFSQYQWTYRRFSGEAWKSPYK